MKITGTGVVASGDFKEVKWVGLTKGGNAITIKLFNAINKGNIDWTIAEKNDIVPQVEFEACYDNTNEAASSTEEPFEIYINGSLVSGADEIVLGAGKFYINNTLVALSRGGGKFTVEREYREINADGDRGAVKGRVVMESSRPKMQLNALTMLSNLTSLYSSLEVSA
jgi:hypothetical protein